MGLLERITAARSPTGRKNFTEEPFWSLASSRYPWGMASTPTEERIENDFESYVELAYKRDGVIFGCINRRQQVFSQARFQWREFVKGHPGDLFGNKELGLLENPWPNGTTGELLAYMEVCASLAGNAFLTTTDERGRIGNASIGKPGRRITKMRPDWTTLVIDAPSRDPYQVDARVVAYLYRSQGVGGGGSNPLVLLPEEVCHYSPLPDPMARFRGMSWLTPILREIESDTAATAHKLAFFKNAATPSMAIKGIKAATPEQFKAIVDMMEDRHAGAANAFRTLYLTDGVDVTPLGYDLHQLDFKAVQGAGEVRITVAAGVPSVILGNSEGLAGSSLNAGNFAAARRLFVDTTCRDLWSKVSASLQVLVKPPSSNTSLWYDAREIPFLREDAKDDAEIRQLNASALNTLTMAGWKPDAAVDYLRTNDLKRLVGQHTGLFSVQLLSPGMTGEPDPSGGSGSASDSSGQTGAGSSGSSPGGSPRKPPAEGHPCGPGEIDRDGDGLCGEP